MASVVILCMYLLAIFLVFPPSTIAQSYKNVSLGSTLTTTDTKSWLSPSGEFAFGFQRIRNGSSGGFLLAIWFNKIKEKTIVWSANRNDIAAEGSKVELSIDGRLVLTDPNGREIWARNSASGAGPAYGAMLDTGNFVLATSSSAAVWRSFDEPTDTILPGQILRQGSRLVSSFSDTNASSGRFELFLDGDLALYTIMYPIDAKNSAYWSATTSGSGNKLIFNQSGVVYLQAENGTLLKLLSPSNDTNSRASQMYQRAILEYDGVFRQYVYPKDSSSGRPMAWSALHKIPDNICLDIPRYLQTGGVACGYNSLCSMGTDRRPRCDCPPGYILNDPNDKLGSCRRGFSEQDCNDESRDVEAFTIHEMLNTNWYGGDYEHYEDVTEDWCKQNCLRDCYCVVAVHNPEKNCWKKRYPLLNGRKDPMETAKAFLKIRKDMNSTAGSTLTTTTTTTTSRSQASLIISVSVSLGCSVFILTLMALLYVFKFKGKNPKNLSLYQAVPGVKIRSFSYDELEKATNGFEEELGSGGFSTVYKAVLDDEDGKIVAVKKLNKMVTEGEQGFLAEVNSISRTNHKNLVQLLGFCNEGQHRLLVYEYMETGSLADLLFKGSRLSWSRRVQVAIDTAKGLCYLHEECSTQIIHCDIKPQNVLLDESLTAKIADFGIAKLLRKDQTRTTTNIRGTRGYVAPEWFRNMPITVKVDVYSFGILLLELICCRKSFVQDVSNEDEMILAEWACDCYKRKELYLLIEDDEEAIADIKRFEKLLMVAIWCIQENPALRPSMKKVMLTLEGSVEVSMPPDPFSFLCSV